MWKQKHAGDGQQKHISEPKQEPNICCGEAKRKAIQNSPDMDTWFHSVWQIVQANWHNSQVRKETEISIVHCAPLLNLVKQPFSLSDCRAVLHESVRDVILKVSNVQDFRPLQLNMFEDFLNKKSTISLPFRIKKAYSTPSSNYHPGFTLFGMFFRDVGAVKPLELMVFCPQQSNQLWGKSYRGGSWWGRSCPTQNLLVSCCSVG